MRNPKPWGLARFLERKKEGGNRERVSEEGIWKLWEGRGGGERARVAYRSMRMLPSALAKRRASIISPRTSPPSAMTAEGNGSNYFPHRPRKTCQRGLGGPARP